MNKSLYTDIKKELGTETDIEPEELIKIERERRLNKNINVDESLNSTSLDVARKYLITPNILRAIKKIKQDDTNIFINDLVDPLIQKEFMEIFNLTKKTKEDFSITSEFQGAYEIVKTNLKDNPDDTQLLNTAQRFLQFMLNNELKINSIDAVKDFKESVFTILDEVDPSIKDKVIDKFNARVEV